MRKVNKIISTENMLLLILMMVSMAIGIWGNYRQLWLESNGFEVETISNLTSIGMLCCSSIALLITLISTKVRIKEIMVLALSSHGISLLGLTCLNGSNSFFLIKLLTLITIIAESIFWIGIYPLITGVKKDKKIYSKKTILQNSSKDIGILIMGLMIGRTIFNKIVDYNIALFLPVMLITIAVFLLGSIDYEEKKDNKIKTRSFTESIKYIFKSKINILYLCYILLANSAYDLLIGLQMIIYTNMFHFTTSTSSLFILICGSISTLVAVYVVRHVKIKTNFTANLLKYIPRIVLYLLAFITNRMELAIIAIFVTLITSRMATEYTDGAYVNLIDNDVQFMYSNIKYFTVEIGEALGFYLAGITYGLGIKYMFLGCVFILVPMLILSYVMSNMYEKIK